MSLIRRLNDWLSPFQKELEPRIPVVTPADVERVITRDFATVEFDAVHRILSEYGGEAWERESDRVRLAALKLANGSIEKLRALIRTAKTDYRDVLGPAEYPVSQIGLSSRLSRRDCRLVQENNWQQYQQWLHK